MGSPHLKPRLFLSLLLFLLQVISAEKHGFVANILCQPRPCSRNSKCVILPAYSGRDSKLILQKLMSHHEIIQQVIISCDGFVWSTPATVYNIQLTISYHLFDKVFFCLVKLFVPLFEVFHLGISEGPLLILCQLCHHRIEYVLHRTSIPPKILAFKVVIYCRKPTKVSVRMW